MPEAKGKTIVEPDAIANNFRGKTVAAIRILLIPSILSRLALPLT